MEKYSFFYFSYKKKYNFKGGIKYLFTKNKSNNLLLKSSPLPEKFFFLIESHVYKKKIRVKSNQKVLRGQPLTFSDNFHVPIHAPTSGLIEKIYLDSNPTEKDIKNIKIVIRPDYLDKWIRLKPIKKYKRYTPEKLIKIIHQSGIVGLGGGQFPSSKKIFLSLNKVHTLIVNAVESEPYITSDNCLIENHLDEVIIGCKIICWITKIKTVFIAVQEDSIRSISKIHSLIKNESCFKICIVKNKYPGGSSKVLIKSLTGKEIPYKKHSIDIGYLIFNIATIFSIKRAIINGEPLTERIITFLGSQNYLSGNFWVRIGTPIKHFLINKKLNKDSIESIFLGGPFMGEKINNINFSISKKINCISIDLKKEKYKNIIEGACIRCSYCSNVCPVNLLPQQLYWYSKKKDHKKSKKYHILDCIECKACEKVCPSYIPLVKYFKKEKIILKNIELDDFRKKMSLSRFKKRKKRLLEEKLMINMNNKNCALMQKNIRKKTVQDAIERMRSKK